MYKKLAIVLAATLGLAACGPEEEATDPAATSEVGQTEAASTDESTAKTTKDATVAPLPGETEPVETGQPSDPEALPTGFIVYFADDATEEQVAELEAVVKEKFGAAAKVTQLSSDKAWSVRASEAMDEDASKEALEFLSQQPGVEEVEHDSLQDHYKKGSDSAAG